MFKKVFSKNKPQFKIENSNFSINTNALIGVINHIGEFCWAMDIYTNEGNFQANNCAPKFSFTDLEPAQQFKKDKEFIWQNTSAYNKTTESWVGSLYVFDSQFFKCSINLKKLSSSEFTTKINGEVNINWENEEGENFVPFSISTQLKFNGILSEIDNKEEALKIASNYLETKDLVWKPKNIDEGKYDNWLV
jgi:hypothetical protein